MLLVSYFPTPKLHNSFLINWTGYTNNGKNQSLQRYLRVAFRCILWVIELLESCGILLGLLSNLESEYFSWSLFRERKKFLFLFNWRILCLPLILFRSRVFNVFFFKCFYIKCTHTYSPVYEKINCKIMLTNPIFPNTWIIISIIIVNSL